MILHGNQRGGGRDLAIHLMKPENEKIDLIQLRGFAANNLMDAFVESHAISKATRCDKHLFSVSINPPIGSDISEANYLNAADRIEKELGLEGQPRAIIRHGKRSEDGVLRSHAHAVWCRIDTDQMKAVHLPFTKLKLRELSRSFHIEHGLKMPPGLINSKDGDPRNFTFEQWQQCKRAGKHARDVKSDFMDAWAISDSPAAFSHALQERGLFLARGNRGHIAVDHTGEKYAVSRYVGLKAKEIRARLGEADDLPSPESAQRKAAQQVSRRLGELRSEQRAEILVGRAYQKAQEHRLREKQKRDDARLRQRQVRRHALEDRERQSRLRKGLPGLWDWLIGKRSKVIDQNKEEALLSTKRNRAELRESRDRYLRDLKKLQGSARSSRSKHFEAIKELRKDVQRLQSPVQQQGSKRKRRRPTSERPKRRSRRQAGPSPVP
ncbi:MAG: relaxase [Pseudomonadota bacterium]